MTYEEARKEAEQILKGAEVPDAALDAWYLLEYAIRKIEKKENRANLVSDEPKGKHSAGDTLILSGIGLPKKTADSAAASDRRTGVLRLSILCQ